ncbi:MAG: cell division protein FtsQ/DivIB [Ostreibacterium sp.]
MHDYASYFIDRKLAEKRGATLNRDIDWWMEYLAGRIAKLLFVVLFAILFLVLKSFWLVGKSHAIFPIKHIVLTGNVLITQPKDIQRVLASLKTASFFNVDLDTVATKIEALAWVEVAQVKRQWPDTLSVSLTERKAAYRWGNHELVDADGNRFANINTNLFDSLPQIIGVDGYEPEAISAYQQLSTALGHDIGSLSIKALVLNSYLSWELHLTSGLVLKFGRDSYQNRLKRFVDAYKQGELPDFAQLETIDFRYKQGFSVKWKPEFIPNIVEKKLIKSITKQI